MTNLDCVVIGGGLAGCMAAITLAGRNRNVALIEAGTYPRHKVCGEFLSPECVALFDAVGFTSHLRALNPLTIRTIRLTAPNGIDWRSTLPAPALSISRYALDEALANYALSLGVDVQTGTRVNGIDGNLANGFTISTQTRTIHASSVIAAHGKRSNLDRTLNRAFFGRKQPYIGLKRHFIGTALPEHIDLHVFRGGYCGMSQVENGRTNVCLLVKQDIFQAAGDISTFIAWMSEQNPNIGRWLSTAAPLEDWLSIGQVPLCAKTPLEGDILMAGDAAGMVAPLAGDGMAMALHSGRLAAESIDRFLSHEQTADVMKRAYARTWTRTFRARLELGRVLNDILIRPQILSLGLRALRQFPTIGDWLVHHTRDFRLLEQTL